MRVLFVAHQFFPEHFAGVETLTLRLSREFKSRGHEPYVFAAKRSVPVHDIEPGGVEDYEYEGIPVRRVGRPTEGLRRRRRFHYDRLNYQNEAMAERARDYARKIGPDVVHAMNFQGITASVVPALKEFGVPIVYTATDFWTICPVVDLRRHDGVLCEGPELAHCVRCMVSRSGGSMASILMKSALERTSNSTLKTAGKLSEKPPFSKTFPLRQVWALKERPGYIREHMEQVDHIVAYTSLMKELLLRNGVGEGKIGISHYGINTSYIPETSRSRNIPPPLRIGFIGTLAPHKGCDTLIRAVRSLPPELGATLDIYGNPKRFELFVQELRGLAGDDERINFAGPFQRENVGQVLWGLDVLVVPSRWYENQPGVILEALAAGMPVVATDLGGMSEFVKHEENGLLFELENERDLARQLRRLGEEPGLIEKLRDGIGPVKTVEQDVDELEELYRSLLDKKG